MKANTHYLAKYEKFISSIKQKGKRSLAYSEFHHVVPRCIGGTDSLENLIELTAREHFVAHWLLWKTYDKNVKLSFAFWSMCCLPSAGRDYFEKISNYFKNSKIYEKLKIEIANETSKYNKNKVYVFDSDLNKLICLTKKQYKKSSLKFHTTGMVNVYDKITGVPSWILSTEYQINKQKYNVNVDFARFKFIDNFR